MGCTLLATSRPHRGPISAINCRNDWGISGAEATSHHRSNTNELHLGKLFHCITYAFAPEAGLLHPPERLGVQEKPAGLVDPQGRSEERRVGKEWVRTLSFRGAP